MMAAIPRYCNWLYLVMLGRQLSALDAQTYAGHKTRCLTGCGTQALYLWAKEEPERSRLRPIVADIY